MSFFSDRRDKKSGAIYRYKIESYWDKDKKAPRNKQVYVGRVDPVTGELFPPKRKLKGKKKALKTLDVIATSKVVDPVQKGGPYPELQTGVLPVFIRSKS